MSRKLLLTIVTFELLVAAAVFGVLAATGSAATRHRHLGFAESRSATIIGRDLKPHKHTRAHRTTTTKTTSSPPPTTTTPPAPPAGYNPPGLRWHAGDNQAICNVGGDPGPWLRSHGANVMRFIVNDREPGQVDQSRAPQCVRRAEAEGYRVFLSVVLNATWTPAQDAQRVRQVIAAYGRVWAVSVGNEEDLGNHAGAMSPARYAAAWNVAEPALAAVDPGALRVYADGSPWSIASNWLPAAWTMGHVAADAIAMNCYEESTGGLAHLAEYAQWAAQQGVPLWCGEGATVNAHQRTMLAQQLAASQNIEMRADYYWPAAGAFTARATSQKDER